jgi:hypothetical protein
MAWGITCYKTRDCCIPPVSATDRKNNFDKAKKGMAEGQGVDYDYRSIMHYSAGAFSKNGQPTIEPKVLC